MGNANLNKLIEESQSLDNAINKYALDAKVKDLEWYQNIVQSFIHNSNRLNHVSQDAEKRNIARIYEFINNDLSSWQDEINYYCGDIDSVGLEPEKMIEYNPLVNKIDVLAQKVYLRKSNFILTHLGDKITDYKNKQYHKILIEKASLELNKSLLEELQQQGQTPQNLTPEQQKQLKENLDQQLEEIKQKANRSDFKTDVEILSSKIAKWLYISNNLNLLKSDQIKHLMAASGVFIKNTYKKNLPAIEIINPIGLYFDKSSEERNISKSNIVLYEDFPTIQEVLYDYPEYFEDDKHSQTRKEWILSMIDVQGTSSESLRGPIIDSRSINDIYSSFNEDTGSHTTPTHFNPRFSKRIRRKHIEFKAFKKVVYLKYINDYGIEVKQFMSDKYIIPKDATERKLVNKWGDKSLVYTWLGDDQLIYHAEYVKIPRRYEVIQLEENIDYVLYREVPNQPDLLENPYLDFELSYKGELLDATNSIPIAPAARVIPYCFQYMAVKKAQDDLLKHYIGFEKIVDISQTPIITDDEEEDEDYDPVYENELIAKKTKTRLYDSTAGKGVSSFNTGLTGRSQGVNYQIIDTSPQLAGLENFANMLYISIGTIIGVPAQEEAMVIPNTNVTDNQQAIANSNLINQKYYNIIDRVFASGLNECMQATFTNIKKSINEGKEYFLTEYILPNNSTDVIKVLPDQIDLLKYIGIIYKNDNSSETYQNYILQNLQPFAQNRGEGLANFSATLKALLESDSIEESNKLIQEEAIKLVKQQQQQMVANEEEKRKTIELEKEMLAYIEKLKQETEAFKVNINRDIKMAEIAADAGKYAMEKDINENKINDDLEIKREELEHKASENQKDRIANSLSDKEKMMHEKEIESMKLRVASKKTTKV